MKMSSTLDAFISGMALLMCPFLKRTDNDRIIRKSDAESLRSDWEAVDCDMRRAMQGFDPQPNPHYLDDE